MLAEGPSGDKLNQSLVVSTGAAEHLRIQPPGRIRVNPDILLSLRFEPPRRNGHVIDARLKIAEQVRASFIGADCGRNTRGDVSRLDLGSGDDRSGLICYTARQRAVKNLGASGARQGESQDEYRENPNENQRICSRQQQKV